MRFKSLLPEDTVERWLGMIEAARWLVTPGMDFRTTLKKIPERGVGCAVVDPPWDYRDKEIPQLNKVRLLAYPTLDRQDVQELLVGLQRVVAQDRNIWVWSDWKNLPSIIGYGRKAGLRYFGTCVVKRKRLGLGIHVRKQVYFLVGLSTGKPQVRAHLSEYLGEYDVAGSRKPWEVTLLLLRHSLPPKEKWLDPFPPTHQEQPKFRKEQALSLELLYQPTFTKVVGKNRKRLERFDEVRDVDRR